MKIKIVISLVLLFFNIAVFADAKVEVPLNCNIDFLFLAGEPYIGLKFIGIKKKVKTLSFISRIAVVSFSVVIKILLERGVIIVVRNL